jgi:hypothetical protein
VLDFCAEVTFCPEEATGKNGRRPWHPAPNAASNPHQRTPKSAIRLTILLPGNPPTPAIGRTTRSPAHPDLSTPHRLILSKSAHSQALRRSASNTHRAKPS